MAHHGQNVADSNLARFSLGGAGVTHSTAGVVWGGYGTGGASLIRAETEVWNGSGWTEVNDLNTARNSPGSAGIVTAAGLTFGGAAPPHKWSIQKVGMVHHGQKLEI